MLDKGRRRETKREARGRPNRITPLVVLGECADEGKSPGEAVTIECKGKAGMCRSVTRRAARGGFFERDEEALGETVCFDDAGAEAAVESKKRPPPVESRRTQRR